MSKVDSVSRVTKREVLPSARTKSRAISFGISARLPRNFGVLNVERRIIFGPEI